DFFPSSRTSSGISRYVVLSMNIATSRVNPPPAGSAAGVCGATLCDAALTPTTTPETNALRLNFICRPEYIPLTCLHDSYTVLRALVTSENWKARLHACNWRKRTFRLCATSLCGWPGEHRIPDYPPRLDIGAALWIWVGWSCHRSGRGSVLVVQQSSETF